MSVLPARQPAQQPQVSCALSKAATSPTKHRRRGSPPTRPLSFSLSFFSCLQPIVWPDTLICLLPSDTKATMSLPTAKPPAQSSIKSFFSGSGQQPPKYAPRPPSMGSAPPPGAAPPPPPPAAAPVASRPLPKEANIRSITSQDLTPLRRINSLLLPVAFADSFYDAALDNPYSRVITWGTQDGQDEKVVGALVCNLEPAASPTDPTCQNLYIRSLCLLSPYRSLGLMDAALDSVVATALADSSVDVRTFTAHVWTENDDGLAWYRKRGFSQSDPIQDYYLKLRPGSAYLVTKQIRANVRSSLPPPPPTAEAASSNGPPPSAARPPPPPSTTAAVMNMPQAVNFQNRRPETEWNDLPADMAPGLLIPPPRRNVSEANSNASSRSSSTAKKKKDRYPAAAFGN